VLAMGAYLNLELALDTQNEPGDRKEGLCKYIGVKLHRVMIPRRFAFACWDI
jgi:hypothetical protein